MALGFQFNQSVGALITEGPLGRLALDGAREIGLQLNTRAPGVEPGLSYSGPAQNLG